MVFSHIFDPGAGSDWIGGHNDVAAGFTPAKGRPHSHSPAGIKPGYIGHGMILVRLPTGSGGAQRCSRRLHACEGSATQPPSRRHKACGYVGHGPCGWCAPL